MYGRGHEQGTRKQRTPTKPWWADDEEAAIRKVEQEWAEQARYQENQEEQRP